jgi:hypothetical protein
MNVLKRWSKSISHRKIQIVIEEKKSNIHEVGRWSRPWVTIPLKNLKVEPIFKFIQNCRGNWKEHIERMDSSRIPNNLLNYRPHGKRSLGRPLKNGVKP